MDAFQKEIRGSSKKGVCGLYFKKLVEKGICDHVKWLGKCGAGCYYRWRKD